MAASSKARRSSRWSPRWPKAPTASRRKRLVTQSCLSTSRRPSPARIISRPSRAKESRAEFDALAEKARATLILPRVADENPHEAAGRSYAQAAATVLAQSELPACRLGRRAGAWQGRHGGDSRRGGAAGDADRRHRCARRDSLALVRRSGVAAARPARERAADRARPRRRSSRRRSSASPSPREQDRAAGPARLSGVPPRAVAAAARGLEVPAGLPGPGSADAPGRNPLPQHPAEAERMLADGGNGEVQERLDAAWMAADDVAVYYAHAFRSAFVVNFLFGALAVAGVAASLVTPDATTPIGRREEPGFVAAVVVGTWIARTGDWRRRWFEARETAERLRLAPCFWTMGVWPKPRPRTNLLGRAGTCARCCAGSQHSQAICRSSATRREGFWSMCSKSRFGIMTRPSAKQSAPIFCSR